MEEQVNGNGRDGTEICRDGYGWV